MNIKRSIKFILMSGLMAVTLLTLDTFSHRSAHHFINRASADIPNLGGGGDGFDGGNGAGDGDGDGSGDGSGGGDCSG